MENSKKTNFKRLAEKRVSSVIEKIHILANLSNIYAYEYKEEQIEMIFGTLERELEEARSKFDEGLRKLEARKARAMNGAGDLKAEKQKFELPD